MESVRVAAVSDYSAGDEVNAVGLLVLLGFALGLILKY